MTNKELILKFYDEVFNSQNLANINQMMRDDYKQHSAGVADGKAGFLQFCDWFFPLKPHMEIRHIISEGDMVCVFFKCTVGATQGINKVADIYRVKEGMLAEHWDCVEHEIGSIIPMHNNGLF